jgi:hypothetical protein
MTGAQRELEWWMRVIVQRLRATPEVRAHLAGLDRQAAAVRLAELAVLELKADPGMLDLLQRARVEEQAGSGRPLPTEEAPTMEMTDKR